MQLRFSIGLCTVMSFEPFYPFAVMSFEPCPASCPPVSKQTHRNKRQVTKASAKELRNSADFSLASKSRAGRNAAAAAVVSDGDVWREFRSVCIE